MFISGLLQNKRLSCQEDNSWTANSGTVYEILMDQFRRVFTPTPIRTYADTYWSLYTPAVIDHISIKEDNVVSITDERSLN